MEIDYNGGEILMAYNKPFKVNDSRPLVSFITVYNQHVYLAPKMLIASKQSSCALPQPLAVKVGSRVYVFACCRCLM